MLPNLQCTLVYKNNSVPFTMWTESTHQKLFIFSFAFKNSLKHQKQEHEKHTESHFHHHKTVRKSQTETFIYSDRNSKSLIETGSIIAKASFLYGRRLHIITYYTH